MKEKSTQELLDALSGARDLDQFMEENRACFDRRRLAEFLQQYMKEKGLKRGEVIRFLSSTRCMRIRFSTAQRNPAGTRWFACCWL